MPTFSSVFLFLGIASLPIYIFESGLPQPSHFFLSVFFLIKIFSGKISLKAEDKILSVLFILSLFREAISTMGGGDPKFLVYPIFTLFNLCVIIFIREYLRSTNDSTRGALVYGITGAAIIALLGVVTGIAGGFEFSRTSGTFNNPNQPAYFSVCLGVLSLTLFLGKVISVRLMMILAGTGFFLTTLALSKAGLVAYGIALFGLWLVLSNRIHWVLSFISLMAIPIAVYGIISSRVFEQARSLQRLRGIGSDGDDNLYERGYLMYQYVESAFEFIFGLGSDKIIDTLGHEVHSTLVYNFMTYGFPGFLLYISFIYIWARKIKSAFGTVAMMGVCIPPLLYGLAHNGTRFTIFYVAIVCGITLASDFSTNLRTRKFRIRNQNNTSV